MNKPEYFEMVGNIAVCRLVGQFSLQELLQRVVSVTAYAREQHLRKLVIVTTQTTGFKPPSVTARYQFIKELVRASGRIVRVALVAKPEMIDEEKFGVTVAANEGLTAEIFEHEHDAIAWFQSMK